MAFGVLEVSPLLVFGVSGDVDLLEHPDGPAIPLDQVVDVESPSVLLLQRVAESEPDPEPTGLVPEGLGESVRHLRLVVMVGLFEWGMPAGKERGQSQLGKRHDSRPLLRCVAEEVDQSLDDVVTR